MYDEFKNRFYFGKVPIERSFKFQTWNLSRMAFVLNTFELWQNFQELTRKIFNEFRLELL